MTTHSSDLAPLTQRYIEDVRVGDQLPGFELELDWTKMAEQVSGSQDFYPVHHDPGFAAEAGHESIFYNTGFTQAALCRVITDWTGPEGWLRKFRFEMRRMLVPDDIVQARGKVIDKRVDGGGGELDLEVWLETERSGVTTPGWATVRLPQRS